MTAVGVESGILPKECMCGHVHETERGEEVELCLDCSCSDRLPRCQNCGGEAVWLGRGEGRFDACSGACLLQLEYADKLKAVA